jgi:protein-tyrosine phosphatase
VAGEGPGSLDPLDPPLRVDWLDATRFADGRHGRLGMTILPGKHGASDRYPGLVYRRDLERDLDELRAAGIRHLVLLVTDQELVRWGDPDIVARAAAAGVEIDRRPMPDGAAPRSFEEMASILAAIRRARGTGDVAVACMGGVGRTGTVAACALVEGGVDPDEAVAEVRRVRHPTAVETAAQLAFVRGYWRDRTGAHRESSDTVSP